jgi:hypothetical protein
MVADPAAARKEEASHAKALSGLEIGALSP